MLKNTDTLENPIWIKFLRKSEVEKGMPTTSFPETHPGNEIKSSPPLPPYTGNTVQVLVLSLLSGYINEMMFIRLVGIPSMSI